MTALNPKSNIHKILKPCNMCFNIYETWHCLPFVMYIEACSGWHSSKCFSTHPLQHNIKMCIHFSGIQVKMKTYRKYTVDKSQLFRQTLLFMVKEILNFPNKSLILSIKFQVYLHTSQNLLWNYFSTHLLVDLVIS